MKKTSEKLINDFALEQFLCQYPSDEDFSDILERLSGDDLEGELESEQIIISDTFDNMDPSNLSERIQEFRDNLKGLVETFLESER